MRERTILSNAMFAKLGNSFEKITLPHTWNNLDGQDGGADYWRGIGIYNIDLPNPTEGKKQYIEMGKTYPYPSDIRSEKELIDIATNISKEK